MNDDKSCNFCWIWAIVLFIFVGYMSEKFSHRYQSSGHGQNESIIVDSVTGEAWITDSSNPSDVQLKPVRYAAWSQRPQFSYIPNLTRSNENMSLEDRISSKLWFNSKFKQELKVGMKFDELPYANSVPSGTVFINKEEKKKFTSDGTDWKIEDLKSENLQKSN